MPVVICFHFSNFALLETAEYVQYIKNQLIIDGCRIKKQDVSRQ